MIFFALLIVRFWISTLSFNNDMLNHQAWVKSIKTGGFEGFYSRDVSPWASPNYPPLITASFYYSDVLANKLHLTDYKVIFALYKLPAIAVETAAIVIILAVFGPFCAIIAALNPGIIYNTLLWGQTEGLVAGLVLLCLYLFFKKFPFWAMICFALALLVKQSSLIFAPLVFLILFKNFPLKKTFWPLVGFLILIFISFIPFAGKNFTTFTISFFQNASAGQAHQWQASVNALNFWYATGLNLVKDSTMFLNFSYRNISIVVTAILFVVIVYRFYKSKYSFENSLLASGMINFAVCIFLTRVHERHLLPTLLLLVPLAFKTGLNFVCYLALSSIYFINLYLIWNAKFYTTNENYLKILSIINIAIFIYFLFVWSRQKPAKLAGPVR